MAPTLPLLRIQSSRLKPVVRAALQPLATRQRRLPHIGDIWCHDAALPKNLRVKQQLIREPVHAALTRPTAPWHLIGIDTDIFLVPPEHVAAAYLDREQYEMLEEIGCAHTARTDHLPILFRSRKSVIAQLREELEDLAPVWCNTHQCALPTPTATPDHILAAGGLRVYTGSHAYLLTAATLRPGPQHPEGFPAIALADLVYFAQLGVIAVEPTILQHRFTRAHIESWMDQHHTSSATFSCTVRKTGEIIGGKLVHSIERPAHNSQSIVNFARTLAGLTVTNVTGNNCLVLYERLKTMGLFNMPSKEWLAQFNFSSMSRFTHEASLRSITPEEISQWFTDAKSNCVVVQGDCESSRIFRTRITRNYPSDLAGKGSAILLQRTAHGVHIALADGPNHRRLCTALVASGHIIDTMPEALARQGVKTSSFSMPLAQPSQWTHIDLDMYQRFVQQTGSQRVVLHAATNGVNDQLHKIFIDTRHNPSRTTGRQFAIALEPNPDPSGPPLRILDAWNSNIQAVLPHLRANPHILVPSDEYLDHCIHIPEHRFSSAHIPETWVSLTPQHVFQWFTEWRSPRLYVSGVYRQGKLTGFSMSPALTGKPHDAMQLALTKTHDDYISVHVVRNRNAHHLLDAMQKNPMFRIQHDD